MHWPAAVAIGVVSNLDNLGAGVAFGMRGKRIGATANVIVAGITMAATAAAVTCGDLLSKLIPSAVTGWLGPLIIIAIGVATLRTWAPTPPDCARAPRGASGNALGVDRAVAWREAMVLGVALSLNNLGNGVGAGVAGIPALATTVSAGLLSLASVGGGCRFGQVLGRLVLRGYGPLVAGILLLAVGAAMLPGVR